MIYTKDEEIEVVRENLRIFEGELPDKLSQQLLQKHVRLDQHGLFFSLCNPQIFPYLLSAMEVIKQYDRSKYFFKAVKKLKTNSGWIHQKAAVAEIIAVSYYFHKFSGSTDVRIEWERKVPNSTKVMDISLIELSKPPINIEVTAKDFDDRLNKHFELRDKIQVSIEQAVVNLPDQNFSYIFSLTTREENEETITDFSKEHIEDFIKFILRMRDKGPGEYDFISLGVVLASVAITKLNKVKTEYADSLDTWVSFMKDEERIRNRIVEKAGEQLPPNDINFVFVPNLGGFDEINYQEAFLGKEQWHINRTGVQGVSRKPDGAIHMITEKRYSPVYGVIWSGWDYSQKKLVVNPLLPVDESVLKAIQ